MRMSLLAGLLLVGGCGNSIVADPAFPRMSAKQVEAMIRARQTEPDLNEWWVRYGRAWCKADGLSAAACAGPAPSTP
jgi:hypothetical protein